MLSKLYWYFWQLFPCTYRTFYLDEKGLLHFAVWKMWLGRCYRATDVYVDCLLAAVDDSRRVLCALEAEADRLARECQSTCPELGTLPVEGV